jgi:endonuclease YncB( thermonuclease family)
MQRNMTERQYVYKIAEIVKVTDGDTYWLHVDAGFRAHILINVRLNGYDCPEAHKGSDWEKDQATKARDIATAFLTGNAGHLWIQTEKDPDNFGRWLGDIWAEHPDGYGPFRLGEGLRNMGLASVWPTRWRDEYDPLDAIPVEPTKDHDWARLRQIEREYGIRDDEEETAQ